MKKNKRLEEIQEGIKNDPKLQKRMEQIMDEFFDYPKRLSDLKDDSNEEDRD